DAGCRPDRPPLARRGRAGDGVVARPALSHVPGIRHKRSPSPETLCCGVSPEPERLWGGNPPASEAVSAPAASCTAWAAP
ncbi:hypothetical protein, partial [Escherichia coli]|uniref:hypothetical protein n=1 Tax=Escherichia coli TaxID=562 RepID=UPI0039DF9A3D